VNDAAYCSAVGERAPVAGAARLAIITGAAAGIGLATVRRFQAAGFRCVAIDRDAAALERLQADAGERVEPVLADLMSDDLDQHPFLKLLSGKFAHVTLVNNVGGSPHGRVPLRELSWQRSLDTLAFNLKPMFGLVRLVLPLLERAGCGRIVNVSSVAARSAGLDVCPDYAGAKAALIAASRQLIGELAGAGILINTVCPGIIATDRILRRWHTRSLQQNEAVLARIPLGRLGTPDEVAEAIHFLGSEANTYLTGAVIDINGGLFAP
jgi:3-oxoacyl-[acyl-carrier protein] reductase